MSAFRYSPIDVSSNTRPQGKVFRPRHTLLVAAVVLTIFLALSGLGSQHHRDALASYVPAGWGGKIDLESPDMDRILRLNELKVELIERFEHLRGEDVRDWNKERIDALIRCIAEGTCGKNQQTIVVMASFHFGNAQLGIVGGEDIWAGAVDEAIEGLGYTGLYAYGHTEALTMWLAVPDMITRFIMEASDLEECLKRTASHQTNTLHHDDGTWQDHDGLRVGCIKRKGYEEGIPIWKLHSFHGWPNPAHILGANFTVSLEPFRDMGMGANYYIGYSIQTKCEAIAAPKKKEHQAMVLGKNVRYFSNDDKGMAFPGMLARAASTIVKAEGQDGIITDFRVVAVAGQRGEELEEPGLENKGFMSRSDWYTEVAKSKVLIGIGRPPQSPSAYDGMCLGTPFINPMIDWRHDDPDNKAHWKLQQPALIDVHPPYVYTVRLGDEDGLRDALAAAVANPIDRYILPRMTRKAMRDRMDHFLTFDWKAEAERIIQSEVESSSEPFAYEL